MFTTRTLVDVYNYIKGFVKKTSVLLTGYFINTSFLDFSLSDLAGSDGDQVISSQLRLSGLISLTN
jgi:hypothetical protein